MPRSLNDYNADRAESSKSKDKDKPFIQPKKVAIHIGVSAPGMILEKRKRPEDNT